MTVPVTGLSLVRCPRVGSVLLLASALLVTAAAAALLVAAVAAVAAFLGLETHTPTSFPGR